MSTANARIESNSYTPSSECTATNHQQTSTLLIIRTVVAAAQYRNEKVITKTAISAWERLLKIKHIRSTDGNAETATTSLTRALDGEYSNETEFDKALFAAAKQLFQPMNGLPDGLDAAVVWQAGDKAVAISRQMSKDNVGIPDYFGICTEQVKNNHSVVLLEKSNAGWKVTQCSASVELKMSDTMTTPNRPKKPGNSIIEQPPVSGNFGVIAQAISYVLSIVWPCLARMGKTKKKTPIIVIAAKRKSEQVQPENIARWLRGDFLAPDHCGGPFQFIVDRMGLFEEDESLDNALQQYLSVLYDGIKRAVDFAKNEGSPKPTSGLKLHLGDDAGTAAAFAKKFALGSSPVSRSNGLLVSRGDVWCGTARLTTAEVDSFSAQTHQKVEDFRGAESVGGDMLVKVSSRPIHGVDGKSMDALKAIKDLLVDGPLLVALRSKTHFTTIMMDLRKTHESLTLRKWANNGDKARTKLAIWEQFEVLVRKTLLPAAAKGVVFWDLRCGFDYTSNILRNRESGELCLIDFESFGFEPMICNDARYLSKYEHATTYVFMQALCLGACWHREYNQMGKWLKDVGLTVWRTFPGIDSVDLPVEVTISLLKHFEEEFEENSQASGSSLDDYIRSIIERILSSYIQQEMNADQKRQLTAIEQELEKAEKAFDAARAKANDLKEKRDKLKKKIAAEKAVTSSSTSSSGSDSSSSEDEAPEEEDSSSDSAWSSDEEGTAPKAEAATTDGSDSSSSDSDPDSSDDDDDKLEGTVVAKKEPQADAGASDSSSSGSDSPSDDDSDDDAEDKKDSTPATKGKRKGAPASEQSTDKRMKIGEEKNTKLFVRGLPWHATEHEVRGVFQAVGKIVSFELPLKKNGRSSGTAVVEYETAEGAAAGIELNGQDFQGRSMSIKYHTPRPKFQNCSGGRGYMSGRSGGRGRRSGGRGRRSGGRGRRSGGRGGGGR